MRYPRACGRSWERHRSGCRVGGKTERVFRRLATRRLHALQYSLLPSLAAPLMPSPFPVDPAWMQAVWGVLLILAAVACWITNAVALPGNWMIVGLAALFAWLLPPEANGRGFGWMTVAGLAAIAVAGEVLEFAAGAAGAAKHGSSRRAMLLAMVGAMVGSLAGAIMGIPIPVVGPLIAAVGGGAAGAFGGAYLGELWKGKTHAERAAVSQGALLGRLFGTVGKLAAGAAMIAVLAIMTFWPVG